jgi:hypothetical protein
MTNWKYLRTVENEINAHLDIIKYSQHEGPCYRLGCIRRRSGKAKVENP